MTLRIDVKIMLDGVVAQEVLNSAVIREKIDENGKRLSCLIDRSHARSFAVQVAVENYSLATDLCCQVFVDQVLLAARIFKRDSHNVFVFDGYHTDYNRLKWFIINNRHTVPSNISVHFYSGSMGAQVYPIQGYPTPEYVSTLCPSLSTTSDLCPVIETPLQEMHWFQYDSEDPAAIFNFILLSSTDIDKMMHTMPASPLVTAHAESAPADIHNQQTASSPSPSTSFHSSCATASDPIILTTSSPEIVDIPSTASTIRMKEIGPEQVIAPRDHEDATIIGVADRDTEALADVNDQPPIILTVKRKRGRPLSVKKKWTKI